MNWVDILLMIILCFAVAAGYQRGFILGSLGVLAWVGSLVLGYLYYPYTAHALNRFFQPGVWLQPLAFIITVLFALTLIGILINFITRSIPENANSNPLNKVLGIIPGIVNGLLCIVIISALLLSLPLRDGITNATRDSRFAGTLAMKSEWANRKLAPVFDDAVRQTMNSLTVNQKSEERINLSFKYTKADPRPDFEAQMLVLVNNERTSRGLRPLEGDPEMTAVARAHSADMFAKGYFSHVNPDGKDPFHRIRDANVSFLTAGENLALAQTVEMAHTNLMNSPDHKANILHPSFGRLGIGIMDGGYYGLMISQEFRN